MLFTIIRDFYVQHVWGGVLSDGTRTNVGRLARLIATNGSNKLANGDDIFVTFNGAYNDGTELSYINLCDWLSTTSTIITLLIILVCIGLFIRWIFKVVSNSILLR